MTLICRPDAQAAIRGGTEHSHIRGIVRFLQTREGALVEAEIFGLPESKTGFFGFHIHEGADCCGEGFADTGGHYNPAGKNHPNHAGDLPVLLCDGGRAYLAVVTNRFCVKDIIGRTVVIHSGSDDYRSQPAGDSGKKIACGVICRR